jgi:hypothetical protein
LHIVRHGSKRMRLGSDQSKASHQHQFGMLELTNRSSRNYEIIIRVHIWGITAASLSVYMHSFKHRHPPPEIVQYAVTLKHHPSGIMSPRLSYWASLCPASKTMTIVSTLCWVPIVLYPANLQIPASFEAPGTQVARGQVRRRCWT